MQGNSDSGPSGSWGLELTELRTFGFRVWTLGLAAEIAQLENNYDKAIKGVRFGDLYVRSPQSYPT